MIQVIESDRDDGNDGDGDDRDSDGDDKDDGWRS